MSSLSQAMLINALVLIATLQADLGAHRTIGTGRILRPVLIAAAIVPLFLKALTTQGAGLHLEVAGAVLGGVLGLFAVSLMTVYRSPRNGRPTSRAGVGYAALWTIVIGARAAFSYGSTYWFRAPLGTWMVTHDITTEALIDTLVLMAVAMLLVRTVGLAGLARRAATTRRLVPSSAR